MKKIFIVDYGLGNIRSVEQSLKKVVEENNHLAEISITNNSKNLDSASHIILPGQGAFASCMKGLTDVSGMIDSLSKKCCLSFT